VGGLSCALPTAPAIATAMSDGHMSIPAESVTAARGGEDHHHVSQRSGTPERVVGIVTLCIMLAIGTLTHAAPQESVDTGHGLDVAAGLGEQGVPNSRALAAHMNQYTKHNTAVILVKPYETTHSALRLVNQILRKAGISVVRRRRIGGGRVSNGDIYSDVTQFERYRLDNFPANLVMSPEKETLFEKTFGESWDSVKGTPRLVQLGPFAGSLGMNEHRLALEWCELEENVARLKISEGFEVGFLRGKYLVSPAFYPRAEEYEEEGKFTNVLEVIWKPSHISYADFLTHVIGTSTPEMSHPSSIRHQMYLQWRNLSLSEQTNGLWNGIEASENLYQSMLWAQGWFEDTVLDDHPIANELQRRGVDLADLDDIIFRPLITYQGKEAHFFDFLHALNRKAFLKTFVEIFGMYAHAKVSSTSPPS